MKLRIKLSIGTGMFKSGSTLPIPSNAILFNGVPLLYNGEYITFTNA
jgi:hypothetical protein